MDSEEERKFYQTEARTSKRGYIRTKEAKLESDVGRTVAMAKDDSTLTVYKDVSGEEELFKVEGDQELVVLGKKEKGAWLSVKMEGERKFYQTEARASKRGYIRSSWKEGEGSMVECQDGRREGIHGSSSRQGS